MTPDQHERIRIAFEKLRAELEGVWPRGRKRSRLQHMIGYSRGRGRRPIPGLGQED